MLEVYMSTVLAKEFAEIPNVLSKRQDLREAMVKLIENQPMPGKVTEGSDRLTRFRELLKKLTIGELNISEAYSRTENELSRDNSIYFSENKTFPKGWAEKLVKTQFSRFYNQVVIELLLADGQTKCFVPHSSEEDANSKCSRELAGKIHDISLLYERLIDCYARGNWSNRAVKIPDHPNCTHVITHVEFAKEPTKSE
jgi:hypothetical protein